LTLIVPVHRSGAGRACQPPQWQARPAARISSPWWR